MNNAHSPFTEAADAREADAHWAEQHRRDMKDDEGRTWKCQDCGKLWSHGGKSRQPIGWTCPAAQASGCKHDQPDALVEALPLIAVYLPGAQARLCHAVRDTLPSYASALCGAEPRTGTPGWLHRIPGPQPAGVTCPRCIARMATLRARK